MGKGFYSQCNNLFTEAFAGTAVHAQCMYGTDSLGKLPTGKSSIYVETKNSGGCFFESSYFVEGYAVPGTPAGQYNLCLGFTEAGLVYKAAPSVWCAKTIFDPSNSYIFWLFIPWYGISASLDSFQVCGDQLCVAWTINGGPTDQYGTAPDPPSPAQPSESAPSALVIPEDGSDYQGPPK